MARVTYKHEKLTGELRQWLSEHGVPGERFPSVKQLMDDYGVSQVTLTHAMKPLFDEGLLYSVSGKGTYVGRTESENNQVSAAGRKINTVHCVVSMMDIADPTVNSFCWHSTREIIRKAMDCSIEAGCYFHVTPMMPVVSNFTKLDRIGECAFIFLEYLYFEPLIEYCVRQGIPYVVYAGHSPLQRAINQVWLDVKSAEIRMMELLISRGHRVIGYIGDRADSERSKGYREALRKAGIPCRREQMVYELGGKSCLSEGFAMGLLNKFPDMTAISCSSDERAEGVWRAAQTLGRNIEITGIDNLQEDGRWFSQKLDFAAIGDTLAKQAMNFDCNRCESICIALPDE